MTQIIATNNGGGKGGGGGEGDMLKSVYDPNNVAANAFDYNNFINTPTIPAAQVQSDWDEADNTQVDYIKNKPTIPTVNNSTIEIQKNGTKVKDFTLNQSSGETINITVPTDTSDLTNGAGFITGVDWGDIGGALSDQTDLATALSAKADDSAVVKLSGNQTINGTKTFGTSPLVPSKTAAATNDGTAIATEAQVKLVADDVATINGKIPSAATSSNQLADKNYVDDGINSVTAYYITKNAQGDQWATRAELFAATTFYSGGVVRVPTKNDYTIVLADENHDNATTRYIYNSGWEYQYTVNETALTQAQLDALNSGITSGKVSTYDGYATTISGKQDALTLPSTPTQGNLVTWGANNKTLADGGAIPTVPTNVSAFNNDAGYLTSATGVTSVNGNTGAVTVSEFSPSGTATTGYVVTKTAGGYEWAAPTGFSPSSAGSTGQQLNKTAGGYDWAYGVSSGDSANYTIKVSSSAPASGTANTVITFVTA